VEFTQLLLGQERLPTTSDVLGRIDAITSAVGALNDRITALGAQMPTREEITAIRDAVAQSNATISEIAGDMAELSANNATLVETVARLEQQIRDMNDPALDALVGEVKAAVDAQSAALRSIADVVPEVEPSPSPTPSPEPGPPPAEPTFRRR
jgi:uncharacterized coiled-coil protein SlyX